MPIYEYENVTTGERVEVLAPMRTPPPELICFPEKGSDRWEPVESTQTKPLRHGEYAVTEQGLALVFRRVYTAGQPPIVKKYGVEYAGQALPVSRALPLDLTPGTVENRGGHTVLRHADGGYTDMKGRRLIANKQDVERAEASTGMKRD